MTRRTSIILAALLCAAPALAQTSPIASPSQKQKAAPAAKMGGLLNTDVTPAQARATVKATNRQVLRHAAKRKRR